MAAAAAAGRRRRYTTAAHAVAEVVDAPGLYRIHDLGAVCNLALGEHSCI